MTRTTKSEFPEIEEIRSDLDSLKDNVVELTRHIQANGAEQIHEFGTLAQKRAVEMKKAGRRELRKVEGQIKAHPGQSIALAFAAGMALSLLMGRKG
jgi:ElaB/YqjD/DUF883 family membrane-anchored ribosome-binding protein